ncbi:MAG: hypothetical protein OXU69_16810 [Gemmatimonadota bacterium]|nr:hypothetical protein [Gemmatimonadota bacterium]MDE2986366.1 hypothetical protein [Gemmatimonadota bacterium]
MGRGRRSQILVQVAGIPSLIARRVLSRLRDKGVPEEVVPAQAVDRAEVSPVARFGVGVRAVDPAGRPPKFPAEEPW